MTNLNNHSYNLMWNVEEAVKFINEPAQKVKKSLEFNYLTDKISFRDDFWDFRYLYKPKGNYTHIYDFGKLSSVEYKILLKRIVIQQLLIHKKRFTSVWKNFYYIRRFLIHLEKSLIYEVEEIELRDVKTFTNLLNYNHYDTKRKYANSLKIFFDECNVNKLTELKSQVFAYLDNYALWSRDKKFYKRGRTFNIPLKIQKNIVMCALKDIDDKELSTRNKVISCAVLILFFTGMRRNELLSLEANKLREISIFKNSKKAYILEFMTYKTVRESNGRWTKAKAFPELVYAYQSLEKLTIPIRKEHQSNYLFLNKYGNILGVTQLITHLDNFFHRHQNDIDITNLEGKELQQLKKRIFNKSHFKIYGYPKKKEWINQPFYSISTHQFRVALANNLKNKVSLEWLQEHMNHLSQEMTKYYFRDDEEIKETLIYKSNKDGAQLDITLRDDLDSEEKVQEACKIINEFLSQKKLNIFNDLDEILNIFKNNPFNESLVGLCSKAIILLCERQDKLNTIETWYYNSPTIPSIVAVDFTIKRFFEKCKIVNHNKNLADKNEIYTRNFEVEKDSLNRFYNFKLLPEVKLLKDYINQNKTTELIKSHPNLESTVSKINSIEKEISNWIGILKLKKNY